MGLYVRRVRTAAGATAVQIASKVRGVRTIVEHLGSAHDEIELAALVAAARAKITAGQLAFDLDALTPPDAERVTAEPVVTGSRSRVLWDVLQSAYRRLGFDAVDDRVFEYLVLARVVEPTSKADTIRVFAELGVPDPPSLRSIWRSLAKSVEADWRAKIATAAYTHASRHGPLALVLYDVTTLYFEAEYEDKFRKVGMSKERRVDPQITVGLLVDAGGFPLEVHAFEGNKGETTTLIPVLDAFRARHHVEDVVVVADAGMLSAANLTAVEDAGLGFIVGSRVSNAPYDLADQLANRGNFFADGQTIEATRRMGTGKAARDRRVVWQYSAARERRDNRTLNLQIDRAQQVADGKRPIKKDRFVKFTGDKPGINQARIDQARIVIGLQGYVTNIPTAKLDGPAVVAAYHDLFQVEKSFRMAKTDLRARPIFHHKKDSIEAHLTIVFAALAIARDLQNRTGVSIRRIVRELRPLRDVTTNTLGHDLTAATPARPRSHRDPRRPQPPRTPTSRALKRHEPGLTSTALGVGDVAEILGHLWPVHLRFRALEVAIGCRSAVTVDMQSSTNDNRRVEHTITVGELQQDVTAVIDGVQEGHTYTLTDDGRPVAIITPCRPRTWIKAADLKAMLEQLGPDPTLAADLRRLRINSDLLNP